MEASKPGYWAVIPAKVRYDEDLRPNAKLLYAEITALANSEGYCWISNARLAEWFGISPKTVGSLIQQLAGKGYINVELVRDEKKAIIERRIWIDRPDQGAPPLLKNEDTPLKNEDTPPLKNEEENNTSINNKPPASPPAGSERAKTAHTMWKPERFAKFWEYYPKQPDGRKPNKARAATAWNRLKPDDSTIDAMATALMRQKRSDLWTRGIGIPYASTWLNQRMWEEDFAEPAAPPQRREEARPEWI